MAQKQFLKIVAPAVAALIIAGACKSEDDPAGDTEQPVGSDSASTTTTVPGGTTPGGTTPGGTTPGGTTPGGTTPGGTTPGGTTPGGTTPGGTTPGGTTPGGTGTVDAPPACANTVSDGTANGFLGSTWLFSYSDETTAACLVKTTHCIDYATAGQVCFNGTAAAAMSGYECWGAGLGVQMAAADDMGVVLQPFDATSHAIVGIKLTIAGVTGGPPVRAQLAIDGLPDDATFVHNGGTGDIKKDGDLVLMFDEFSFPDWTIDAHIMDLPDLATVALDATKIKAFQLQVTTATGSAKPFNFCVTNASWIDAASAPVVVTPLAVAAGGAGGAGGAGDVPAGGAAGMGGAGGAGGAPPIATDDAGAEPLPSTEEDAGADPVPSTTTTTAPSTTGTMAAMGGAGN